MLLGLIVIGSFIFIKYGLLLLFLFFVWDLLHPLHKEKNLSRNAPILYKGKKLSEDELYLVIRSKRRLKLLTFIALILPLLFASIFLFYPILMEGFAFMGLLGVGIHLLLLALCLIFISLILATALHILGYYTASSYISVAALCIYPCLMIFHPFIPTHSYANGSSSIENHGKPPVKLSLKFSLNFPNIQLALAWSPDSAHLAVAGLWGGKIFDESGHLISQFKANSETSAENFLAFINGSSQIIYPPADMDSRVLIDIRDTATWNIVKTINQIHPNNTSFISKEYLAISPDQKRIAITEFNGHDISYSNDSGNNWYEVPVINTSADERNRLRNLSLCFFPDGQQLAIGKNGAHFSIVDYTTGQTMHEYLAEEKPDINDNISAIAVSPRGDLILTGLNRLTAEGSELPATKEWQSSSHPIVSIWHASDGKQIASFTDPNEEVWHVAWDPKGRFVAFTESDSLILWQPEATSINFTRIRISQLGNALAISPDGKSLAVTSGTDVFVYTIEDN
jgi:hypothetical protein